MKPSGRGTFWVGGGGDAVARTGRGEGRGRDEATRRDKGFAKT